MSRTTAKIECVVVDTNVLAVAEGLHDDATVECVASCVSLARKIGEGLAVVVDSAASGELVLNEYIKTLKEANTSGVGTKLALRLWRRRYDPAVCRVVEITPCNRRPGSFEEVPSSLDDFDVDDHKWVAVALAEGSRPPIFQALDTEWWHRRNDLQDCGLDVQFLCALDLLARH